VQRCVQCNAPQQDDVEACSFCGTLTEHGRRLKLEREAQAREAERRAQLQASSQRAQLLAEAGRSVNRSLLWSLLGLLACCLPLGPIIGIVTARRARELAEKNGASTAHATVALAVGIGCVVFSLGGWGGIGWIAKLEADRKAELHALIAKGDTDATLSMPTACALAELELMVSKYEGFNTLNHDLSCGTRLEQDSDEARLLEAHFTKERERVPVVACFHRVSGRWGVSQVRGDDRCDAPPPAPSGDDGAPKRPKRSR
jgi:hypothetical protein